MPTTMTRPVAELARIDAETRAAELNEAKAHVAFHRDAMEFWEGISRAIQMKTGAPPQSKTGNGARVRAGAKTSTRRPAARPRGKAKTITDQTVLDAIKAGMGDQSPQLAKALKTSSETILRRLRSLENRGLIIREGERRDLRWVIASRT